MDMSSFIATTAVGTIVAGLGLLAEHYALLEQPWELDKPWTYVAGILTILAGCVAWAALQTGPVDPWLAVIAFGIISIGSGFPIIVAYGIEGRLSLTKQRADRVRAKKEQIAGALDDTLDDLRRN